MDTTTALAVLGAVTGTASVGLQASAHFRDRVKLAVGASSTHTIEDVHTLKLRVSNRGRRPTTLVEAGLLIDMDVRVEFEATKFITTGPFSIRLDDGHPVLLQPGEVHEYTQNLTGWPDPMIHADSPLRPYVMDSFGHQVWAEPTNVFRKLMERGWQPKGAVDARLVEPPPEPLLAKPVTPRWKFWRPEHERKPTDGLDDPGEWGYKLNIQMED
jgi:hypothetical protein